MATGERWQEAQEYERAFWQKAADRIASGERPSLTFYQWRAENLTEMIAKAFPRNPPSFASSRVVEIGSGAVGTVAFFDAKERYAYDPLCDFYASRPELIAHRNPAVAYVQAQGEDIPQDSATVDLVIIENVIDHVQNPGQVLNEIDRILQPDGIVFLTVNLHPTWGFLLHSLLAVTKIDRGHPHTYTLFSIRKFLRNAGFETRHEEWESYRKCRKTDWKSGSLKGRLKAISGLSEFLYSTVLTKQAATQSD